LWKNRKVIEQIQHKNCRVIFLTGFYGLIALRAQGVSRNLFTGRESRFEKSLTRFVNVLYTERSAARGRARDWRGAKQPQRFALGPER
jgi:hypothetical protein